MKLNYRPEIDGLRAIAVIGVIIYHAKIKILEYNFLQGGFIGVDIFFVISGYLISSIILKELIEKGSFSLKNFYERRIRRILPALLIVVFFSLPFAWKILLPEGFVDFSKSVLYSLGFSSNFYFHYSGQQYGDISGLLKPYLHTWSLSVEEQFYIIFPIVLTFIFKYFKKYLIYFLIFCFIFSLSIADFGSRSYPSAIFYFLPSRIWELLAGSILAYYEINLGHRSTNKNLNQIFTIIGLLLIGYSFLFFDDKMFHPSLYTLIPIIGVCLIIWFADKKEIVTKIFSTKLFVGIGLISYSLYLWHYPIFSFYRNIFVFSSSNLIAKIFTLVLLIVASFLTYKFIEKPFRNIKQFNTFDVYKYLIISYLFLILFLIYPISSNGLPNRFIPIIKNYYLNKQNDVGKYNFNKNIYIIGDSHAGRLVNNLQGKLVNHQYNLIYLTTPFFENHIKIDVRTNEEDTKDNYTKLNSELSAILKNSKNKIFIFHARYPLYFSGGKYFNDGEGGQEEYGRGVYTNFFIRNDIKDNNNYKNKNQLLIKQFLQSLDKISKNNFVILVYPIPEVGFFTPNKLFINFLLNKYNLINQLEKKKYIFTTSYDVFLKRNFSTINAFDSLNNKNIYKIYPHKFFCNNSVEGRCVTHDNINIFYDDYNHLSNEGSKIVSEMVYKKIIEIFKR